MIQLLVLRNQLPVCLFLTYLGYWCSLGSLEVRNLSAFRTMMHHFRDMAQLPVWSYQLFVWQWHQLIYYWSAKEWFNQHVLITKDVCHRDACICKKTFKIIRQIMKYCHKTMKKCWDQGGGIGNRSIINHSRNNSINFRFGAYVLLIYILLCAKLKKNHQKVVKI